MPDTDSREFAFSPAYRSAQIAAVLLVAWAATVVLRDWNVWGKDLSALYFASRFAAERAWDLAYAAPGHIIGYGMTAEWEAEAIALGHEGVVLNRYVYPPLWAAIFGPVAARVDPLTFFNGFLLLHVGALVAAAIACRRMIPTGCLSPVALAGLTVILMESSFAGIFVLDLAQPQAIVMMLCLLALERAQAGRQIMGGALLALAASIKIAPGLLVLAFAVCGMWGAVGAFAVVGVALLGLSVLSAGLDAHYLFLEAMAQLDGVIFVLAINPSATSLLWLGQMAFAGTDLLALARLDLVSKPDWISALVPALALSAVGATLWMVRGVPKEQRIWLAGAMLYLVMTLFGGFAWIHYLVLPVLMLPGLAAQFAPRTALFVLAALGVGQSMWFYQMTLLVGAPAPQILLGVLWTSGVWALMAGLARRWAASARSVDLDTGGIPQPSYS